MESRATVWGGGLQGWKVGAPGEGEEMVRGASLRFQ